MSSLSLATETLLQKAAHDSGFNLELEAPPCWLSFASSKAPLRIWLSEDAEKRFLAAVSQTNVAAALEGEAESSSTTLPSGAVAAFALPHLTALITLLQRAFVLSRTLPNALLDQLREELKKEEGIVEEDLEKLSGKERIVVERVGQRVYRKGLVDYWKGCCAITGVDLRGLLVASHIKPWRDCDTYAERLDVYNGLLLAVHYDKVFDRGWMTVNDDGSLVWAKAIGEDTRARLGFQEGHRVEGLTDEHRKYLAWHREKVFRKDASVQEEEKEPEDAPKELLE